MEILSYICLLVSVFTMTFSLPAGRGFLVLSLFFLSINLAKGRGKFIFPPVAWLALLFFAVAFLATAFGINPSVGIPKLRKLLWFMAIPVFATLINSYSRLFQIMLSYVTGTIILSFWRFISNPIQAIKFMNTNESVDFISALINQGSMTNAQRLMIGVIITVGFIITRFKRKETSVKWWLILILQVAALILTFKRGSWICACLMVSIFVLLKTNWKYLLILLLVIISSFALSPVRLRLADLKKEFSKDNGGRITMWTKITPAMIKEYPLGIGFRSLSNEKMREYADNVEPDRNHLHSNIAQILVATGWLGFIIYLIWMAKAIIDTIVYAYKTHHETVGEEMYAMALLLMLTGLLINGLVEYNFADGEIVLIYSFIMGCSAAGRLREIQRKKQLTE